MTGHLELPIEDVTEAVSLMPAWEDFRGRRLFITGATGFIGRWLVETLAAANRRFGLGCHVRVLSRQLPAWASAIGFETISGDIRDFAWDGAPCDWVVHGAAPVRQAALRAPGLEVFDQIVSGTRHVLEVAESAGATRFLMLSSGAVYGGQPASPTGFRESDIPAPDPLRAEFSYGAGKRAAETLCALFAERAQLQPVIARCFAFVGPLLPLDDRFAIGNFLGQAARGEAPRLTGGGADLRSYLYASELAAWSWTLLARGVAGRAYNVGSGQPISISETATAVATAAGVAFTPPAPQAGAASVYFPDVTRIGSEFGLVQRVELEMAIRRTLRWIKTVS